jgi:hypothetical protein
MEVVEKVSESVNMFTGGSGGNNNLVELVLDDPHMIYTTTDEKVIELLSIEHQPRKGHDKWTEEERNLT